MLLRLDRQVKAIAAEGLSAAEVYRREDLHRRGLRRPVAPGLLHCPVCGREAATFLPFGLGGRRNALCPTCGSLERHRFLWLYLTRSTRLLRRVSRVLHTAPEPCLEPRLRALPNLRYRSLDLFDPAADVQADLCDLPFAAGDLDLILSSHVLEHLPADGPALAELARVLRPGGRAVIMVPFDPDLPETEEGGHVTSPRERMARFGHPFHYRNYGRDFPRRLAVAGFAVTPVRVKRLLTPHRRRFFRLNDNFLFDCRRR
ncbi:MAG: class I SAM-dependent methyltransferase [Kiloniellaceae bacterium]